LKALIVYGTRWGSTADIAKKIGDTFKNNAITAEITDVKNELPKVEPYDIVVIGSGISMGKWTKETLAFLKNNSAGLRNKKVALFVSCGLVLRDGGIQKTQKEYLIKVSNEFGLKPMEYGAFGGYIDFNGDYGLLASLFVKSSKSKCQKRGIDTAKPYDFRNWTEIANWAEKVAFLAQDKTTNFLHTNIKNQSEKMIEQNENKEILSKLLPHKRWKKILLVTVLVMMVLGGALYGYIRATINKDVVSPIDALNFGGDKKALIVYQVGLSSGPRDASYAFADGLVSVGWQVEVATASPESPSNMSSYELLVIVFPVYGARPGEAAVRYVNCLGDLQQIPTVIINCRLSNAIENIMREQVTAQNGTVYDALLSGSTDLRQYASQIAIS